MQTQYKWNPNMLARTQKIEIPYILLNPKNDKECKQILLHLYEALPKKEVSFSSDMVRDEIAQEIQAGMVCPSIPKIIAGKISTVTISTEGEIIGPGFRKHYFKSNPYESIKLLTSLLEKHLQYGTPFRLHWMYEEDIFSAVSFDEIEESYLKIPKLKRDYLTDEEIEEFCSKIPNKKARESLKGMMKRRSWKFIKEPFNKIRDDFWSEIDCKVKKDNDGFELYLGQKLCEGYPEYEADYQVYKHITFPKLWKTVEKYNPQKLDIPFRVIKETFEGSIRAVVASILKSRQ